MGPILGFLKKIDTYLEVQGYLEIKPYRDNSAASGLSDTLPTNALFRSLDRLSDGAVRQGTDSYGCINIRQNMD